MFTGYRAKTDNPLNVYRDRKDAEARALKLYGERNYRTAPIEDASKYQAALYQLAPLSDVANKIFEALKETKYPERPVDVPSEEEAAADKDKNDLRYKTMNAYYSASEKVRVALGDKHQEALDAVAKIKAKVQELENLLHRSTYPIVEQVPLFVQDAAPVYNKSKMYVGYLCSEFRYF